MNSNKIVYSLNVENVQTVALEEMGRELTDKEILRVIDRIPEYINWYESITFSLHDEIKPDITS